MKRMVTMQDLSCLGKCSLTVIHPVLCVMGISTAVLPTAVLSTHTAFPCPAVMDLSGHLGPTLDHWASIGAEFDGILTGYLANEAQARMALELLDRFGETALTIHDPAMGDQGRLYSGIGPEMVEAHRRLCARASLCMPNLTEGAMLAGIPWEDRTDLDFCRQTATELLKTSANAVLLTGYSPAPDRVGFYCRDAEGEFYWDGPRFPRTCHGTGDIFAAVTAGALLRGRSLPDAGKLAAEFVHRAVANTGENTRFGVAFEPELSWLAREIES